MRSLISLLVVLVASVSAVAQDELRPVAPLVNETTIMVIHVRLDDQLMQTLCDKAKAFQKAMDKRIQRRGRPPHRPGPSRTGTTGSTWPAERTSIL